MSNSLDRRCTRIDLQTFKNPSQRTAITASSAAALDTSKIQAFITPLHEKALHRDSIVSRPHRPKLARPLDFPVRTYIKVKTASPWLSYRKSYRLRFGTCLYVIIAQSSSNDIPREVCVRYFPDPVDEPQLGMLRRRICHENFVETLDIFRFQETTYAVFERMSASLSEIAQCPIAISEIQLAAIIGQVVNGLEYLATQRLKHNLLTCSTILVNTEGCVKIAACERCSASERDQNDSAHIRALGGIAMYIMQDDKSTDNEIVEATNLNCWSSNAASSSPEPLSTASVDDTSAEDRVVGVTDLNRWSSKAASFVAETTSAISLSELKKHPLLMLEWEKRCLIELASIVPLTVSMGVSL